MNDSRKMKIAVLQTGRAPDELRPDHGDYDEMCETLIDIPSTTETFAVLDGEFPERIDAFDALLITGSKHGVYEEHDWIAPLENLIRDAYEKKIKTIGVCFGHQIIAQALGGRVEKSDKGYGVGVMDYELNLPDGSTRHVSLCAWHQDQVVSPPPGAAVLARSEFCEFAGLRYGDEIISFQAHPEFSKEYMAALLVQRRGDVITEEQADRGLRSLEKPVEADLIKARLNEFLTM